jgi:hypothetical protein
MTGGTVASGTYVLTAIDKYNGHSATTTHKETLVISENTMQDVDLDSSKSGGEQRINASFTTSNNVITLNVNCPAAVTSTALYTATTTQLMLMDPVADDHELHTYTLVGADAGTVTGCTPNSLDYAGPAVEVTRVAAPLPAGTGGVISAGTYAMTNLQMYTGDGGASGPTGQSRRETLAVSNVNTDGSTALVSLVDSNGQHLDLSATISGSNLTLSQKCPAGVGSQAFTYSFDGTTLVVYDAASSTATTLTKQ